MMAKCAMHSKIEVLFSVLLNANNEPDYVQWQWNILCCLKSFIFVELEKCFIFLNAV